MPDPVSASAQCAADSAAVTALLRRRRHRRWAAVTAAWVGLAALPTALQVEPRPSPPARLETLRIEGPVSRAAKAATPAARSARVVAAPAAGPTQQGYGALREAAPSELELHAGLSPGRVVETPAIQALLPAAEPAFLPAAAAAAAPSPFLFPATAPPFGGAILLPASTIVPATPGAPTTPTTTPGAPSTGPSTGPTTPPVVTPPVTSTPPPSTPPPFGTPPSTTPPTPPDTGPAVVTPPDSPPDGGAPPVTVVTTPPETGPPIPPENPGLPPLGGGGPAPVAGGVPEPALWFELIAGFGLAGLGLRRRGADLAVQPAHVGGVRAGLGDQPVLAPRP